MLNKKRKKFRESKPYKFMDSHIKISFTILLVIYLIVLFYLCCQPLSKNTQTMPLGIQIMYFIIIFIMLIPAYITTYIFSNQDLFLKYSNEDKKYVLSLNIIVLIVTFAMIYSFIVFNDYNSFKYSNGCIPTDALERFIDMLYFSTMTLTTVGYGDIVPVSKLAKFLVSLEAMTFTVFISFIIMNFTKTKGNKEKDAHQNEENNNE